MSFRTSITFFCVAALLVCYALFIYFPAFPRSIIGWLSLFFVGVPVLFLVEWLGEKTLGSAFFTRLSSPARIALGVPAVVILVLVTAWLVSNASILINR